ncbi:acyl-CoA thioesterase [Geodermatophilus nigrescens]|uniref:Acyl-CoA thioesterase-2 n=1 Tax=Geodermatophilus nigrescens TaxID=1070870 RepID=A0A1M5IG77_9ACTN|nr:acyl-CoA thioesterase II [Geodermatophilus nigrescens]SHG27291.1 acyl-CoA thioesterase-2 [Geodermatophilus nigrescens]
MPPPSPRAPLAALLDLSDSGDDVLRAAPRGGPAGERAFGGAVVAQSLAAAARTVDAGRPVHSLHAYFVRPGDPSAAVDLAVARVRDGGSYTTREVTARQGEAAILVLTCSFTRPQAGPEHQVPALAATPPEDLPRPEEALADAPAPVRAWLDWLDRRHPFDFRFDGPLPRVAAGRGEPAPPRQRFWFRSRETLPDEPLAHAVALAYATDMLLLATAVAPHGTVIGAPGLATASLDHAVWFHGPARADDWLFCEQESTWAGGGRAMCSGRVFDRGGRLVLTVAQEGMVRTAR